MYGHRFMIGGEEPGRGALKRVTWPLIRRVLSYARPYVTRSAVLLLLILAGTGLGLLSPLIFRELIDRAIPRADIPRLNLLALGLLAIPVLTSSLGALENRLSSSISSSVIFDLRVGLYSHLQRMSLRFFTHNKTGELMSRMNNDVLGAQTAVSSTLVDIVTNLVTVAATLSLMLALDWRLTILGLVVLPLFAFIARRLGKKLREVARRQMEETARMNAILQETLNISGALLAKVFGRHGTEVKRFQERAGAVRSIAIEQSVAGGRFFAMMGMAGAVGTALVYLVGGHLVVRGAFTIGTIVAFSSYLGQLYGPLRSLAGAPVSFAQSMVSFERVFEVLDLPVDIQDRPDARPLEKVQGEIVFDGVSFDYAAPAGEVRLSNVKRIGGPDPVTETFQTNGGRGPALQGVSFRMGPGQLTALVGPSGAGKTTISYLVPRLYDPTKGAVRLDGVDLRDLRLESLAAAVGMVMQEAYLFHDTIRANLLYARPDAGDRELESACEAANILGLIRSLPEGFATIVGERGYRLSGGEKQRIALARVILKDPRILVLDEATSHLDSESEALIQEALTRVMRGRTSLVIAHRLSTILAADQILVLNQGTIVEQGTHGELLARSGTYARLYESQFRSARPGVAVDGEEAWGNGPTF